VEEGHRTDTAAVHSIKQGSNTSLNFLPGKEGCQVIHKALFVKGGFYVPQITAEDVKKGPLWQLHEGCFPVFYGGEDGYWGMFS
jgi:hypothetical protein